VNRLITAAAGGLLALFAMYWDDSLHTDVGRDIFWSAPHVLLYGSLAVTLAAGAWWGVARIRGQGLRAEKWHVDMTAVTPSRFHPHRVLACSRQMREISNTTQHSTGYLLRPLFPVNWWHDSGNEARLPEPAV